MPSVMNQYHFLLVDDNPHDRALAIRELLKEFPKAEFTEVSRQQELDTALKATYDVVITDYQLRWTDGIVVLETVRSKSPDVPVIMFTATGSEEVAVRAMKLGLTDYVLKSTHYFVRLPVAVRSALKVMEERRLRKQAEHQFAQSQKMEAVGQLAGGVAHDINNVLSAIIGYSELLLMNAPVGDPQIKYLEEIKAAGLRAREITQQLLVFSRKQLLQLRTLDLDRQIDHMTSMLRRLIGEDIDLSVKHEGGAKPIRADATQIQQMLLNLVVNARDAMPRGGRLNILTQIVPLAQVPEALRPQTDRREVVMLVVRDSGTGISSEVLPRIFEPFFTTKESLKGTGLGLSMVHGSVMQHGGTIDVQSTPGEGTVFALYFPLVEGEEEIPSAPPPPEERPAGSETVLLVEDDEAVRSMVSRVLTLHGYSVLEAGTPEYVFQLSEIDRASLDLLITDVIMPGMNGKELYQELVRFQPDLKVLYMSGYPQDVISNRGELEEGVHFIQKPFSLSSFLERVRASLE